MNIYAIQSSLLVDAIFVIRLNYSEPSRRYEAMNLPQLQDLLISIIFLFAAWTSMYANRK